MSKLELILGDGNKYGLHELQCRFRDYAEEILRPLSKGLVPRTVYGLPPNALGKLYFDEVLKELADPTLKLDKAEVDFYTNLSALKEKAASFDRKKYDSLAGEKKARYAQRFGLEFAHRVKDLMKDYEVPEGCVSITDHVKLYLSWTNTPIVKDPKTGISYPLGLIKED